MYEITRCKYTDKKNNRYSSICYERQIGKKKLELKSIRIRKWISKKPKWY